MAMNTDEAPHWHIPKSSLRKPGGEFVRKCDPTHISTSPPAIWPWIMQPRYPELAVQGRGRSDSSCKARTFVTSQLAREPDCGCPLSQHHKHSIFRDIRGRFPCVTTQRMSPTSNWKSRGFLLPRFERPAQNRALINGNGANRHRGIAENPFSGLVICSSLIERSMTVPKPQYVAQIIFSTRSARWRALRDDFRTFALL